MNLINKRITKLEESQPDSLPYAVRVFGKNTAPVIPDDIGDREVMVMRTVIVDPPVRDAAGNILEPSREVDDDDPIYDDLRAAPSAPKSAKPKGIAE